MRALSYHLQSTENKDEIYSIYASSFGQYAFDDLPAGVYELRIVQTNAPDAKPSKPIIIDLSSHDDLMAKINIAALREDHVLSAEQNSKPAIIGGGMKEEIPEPEVIPPKGGNEPAPP